MDWARAVEINRLAFARIVAELLAMLSWASGARMERLLLPAESALRRLIVIAARGLVVKLPAKRLMPKGLVIAGTGTGPLWFPLFDRRLSFDFVRPENPLFVRVKTYQDNPYNLFNSLYVARSFELEDSAKSIQVSRRLAALSLALKNLSRQARRLAQWKMRRRKIESPKFTSPLRPGSAPGHRKKSQVPIDFILQECHGLAYDALKEDSS